MTEATPTPYTAPAGAPAAKWNVLSIVSLVTGILFFFGLVAVITGHISLSQIKKTGDQGRVLAIIGLILGYIDIALGLLWFLVIIIALIGSATVGTVTTN